MQHVLLHGRSDEAFDRSVAFARQLVSSFNAKLHIVYTVEDPLSAGWTAEMSAAGLPDVHQAMEAEARERLSRVMSPEEQERGGVEIVLRMGPPTEELVRYTREHSIDLAIVHAPAGSDGDTARALLADGECAVLVLR